ncbi:YceI family protein [Phenylobacterium aquaticum]|uniref:YceI family protein n=1 Tax=Phenylobacterium aquaticum TaxID=1763816 RepID=UPI0026E9CC4B|nr:YceI family protein [Phenylobacterium aquaticum]
MTKPFALAVFAGAALISVAAPALAQVSTDPSSVQAGTYALESNHARVVFSVSHMGFSTWYGDFSKPTGSLTIDPKAPAAAKLDVTIPVASVSTTNATLDGELKSAAWFDATTYPTITFHSTSVAPTGANTAKVTGDLTFHGVTKPVTLDVTFKGSGTNMMSKAFTIGFDAKATLKRSDFGVKTYVPMIGDTVDLLISAPFEKK